MTMRHAIHITNPPLFEEPTIEIERNDPWEGPLGFLIGGMALPSKADLSTQYFHAAECLLESIRQRHVEDYTVANPVLFLYGHSIEMLLKSRLPDTDKTHSTASITLQTSLLQW